MVPSGYSDGMLGSVKPTDGSGNFTFTRGTDIGATRVAPDGYIEKGYENLLLQSNSFTTSPWGITSNASVISGYSGYDNSNNAWKAQFNGPFKEISQSVSSSGINTFSVYAKAGDTEWIRITTLGTISTRVFFNIPSDGNGSIGLKLDVVDASIEYISNGWYRCSVVVSNSISSVRIIGAAGDNNTNTNGEYCYIQDAQLNQGLVAMPYLPTTTTTSVGGILANLPRIDYTGGGGCGSLLLEGSRTNRIPNSEYYQSFTNYGTGHSVFEPNAAVSPDNTQNAYKIILNSGRVHAGGAVSTLAGAFTTGDIIAFSIFFKADEFDEVDIGGYFTNESARFNLTDGSVISQKSNVINAYSVPFGDGWYRCTVIYTFQNHVGNNFLYSGYKVIATSNGVASAGDGVKGAFAYGAQFEVGTYPTSYIPTYGTSVTRAGDDVDLTGVSSLIGQNEGSYFIEFQAKRLDEVYSMFSISDGSNNNRIQLTLTDSGTTPRIGFVYVVNAVNGFVATNIQYLVEGQTHKFAVTYTQSSLSCYLDGTQIINETGLSLSGGSFDTIAYGLKPSSTSFRFNMPVKQTLVFNTALSDAELAELTTI